MTHADRDAIRKSAPANRDRAKRSRRGGDPDPRLERAVPEPLPEQREETQDARSRE